jgi:hypothetical protein
MAINTINKNFKNNGKDIKYLNKDFASFRANLIEFAKTYFPKTYSDFNETSPGMMFIEMSSYIGDVLSYYVDDTLKESMMVYAEDVENVISLAQYLGYKPKVTSPALTTLSVYQLVPAIGTGVNNKPDETYYLRVKEGMEVTSKSKSISFITTDVVDFSDSTDREIVVYQNDATTSEPTFYLVKKYIQAISATKITKQFTFSDYQAFQTINLDDTNIIQIIDIRDSNNNKWYEVPYLAQEMVFVDQPNTESNDPDLYQFKSTVPYILKTIKTPRRFVTKVNSNSTMTIQFGSGDAGANDELLVPNFKNVGLGLPNSINRLEESFDPTNFLKTKTYGTSPSNTILTVSYFVGGGIDSNIPTGDLTRITKIEYDNDISVFTQIQQSTFSSIRSSVAVDNEVPAVGGRGGETIEEIRQNALANFGAQNRAVTSKDYQIRALSMPSKFGGISKAYATADGTLDNNSPSSILASPNHMQEFTDLVMNFVNSTANGNKPSTQSIQTDLKNYFVGKTTNEKEKNNPFAINLYLLGYDGNGNLTNLNRGVKENLKTYLNEYKILTDGVNIIDGFIINIGVNFEIAVLKNYNKSDVLTNCITQLKDYFSIDNWTFNQTINISEIELLLANVEGVSSVPMLEFINKCGGKYSSNSYNITAATKGKVIYPSLDPSVFEIKFPNADIKGRAK